MAPSPRPAARRSAILLGALCAFAYFTVYLSKNMLSVYAPEITGKGVFSVPQIGILSTLGFLSYAAGQLGSGCLGDRLRGSVMLGAGLIGAGICCFPSLLFSFSFPAACLFFGLNGLLLSMIFAPMTRLVAENAPGAYAARCTLGYTFASFLGSPCAGALSSILPFRTGFLIATALLFTAGISCTVLLKKCAARGTAAPEKCQALPVPRFAKRSPPAASLRGRRLPTFFLLAMLTGVVRSALVFYLPAYFSDRLGLSPGSCALFFSLATLFSGLSAFLALFLYEKTGRQMNFPLFLFLLCTAAGLCGAAWLKLPFGNLFCMTAAILCANCASNLIWSVYCPSLRDTGRVSSVTGALDFAAYMAAAASSAVFSPLLAFLGWKHLLLVLAGLLFSGSLFFLPRSRPFSFPIRPSFFRSGAKPSKHI